MQRHIPPWWANVQKTELDQYMVVAYLAGSLYTRTFWNAKLSRTWILLFVNSLDRPIYLIVTSATTRFSVLVVACRPWQSTRNFSKTESCTVQLTRFGEITSRSPWPTGPCLSVYAYVSMKDWLTQSSLALPSNGYLLQPWLYNHAPVFLLSWETVGRRQLTCPTVPE